MSYRILAFDFFGVICTDLSLEWLKRKQNYAELLPAYLEICSRSDRGVLSHDGFYQELANLSGESKGAVATAVMAELKVNQPLIGLINDLHQKYKIAVISNTNTGWIEPIVEQYNLASCFDEIIISAAVGLVKPQKEIFELLCSMLDASLAELVFIDDRESNIDQARLYGITSFLYQDLASLRNDLQKIALL